MFRFRRFTIEDDRCAMKVGTDGVLLGAWACVEPTTSTSWDPYHVFSSQNCPCGGSQRFTRAQTQVLDEPLRVLDVGAGCGLVALMLAQRFPAASLAALEIDAAAAAQAAENVERSPFTSQIKVENADFLSYIEGGFDAVVSNPPFFEEDLLPPDAQRANARHTSAGLTFEALVEHSAQLLRDGGSLQVIIPKTAQQRFHALCNSAGFSLVRSTDVRTVERKAPKRVLLHFVKSPSAPENILRSELVLMRDGQRSAEYAELCRDFYL